MGLSRYNIKRLTTGTTYIDSGKCLCSVTKRHCGSTAFEYAVVIIPAAVEFKVVSKPSLVQHPVSIAAYGKHLSGLDNMMLVQYEFVAVMVDSALINNRLTVVFTSGL